MPGLSLRCALFRHAHGVHPLSSDLGRRLWRYSHTSYPQTVARFSRCLNFILAPRAGWRRVVLFQLTTSPEWWLLSPLVLCQYHFCLGLNTTLQSPAANLLEYQLGANPIWDLLRGTVFFRVADSWLLAGFLADNRGLHLARDWPESLLTVSSLAGPGAWVFWLQGS